MTARIYTMDEFAEMLRIGMAVQYDVEGFRKAERIGLIVDQHARRDAKLAFVSDICRLPADKATSDEVDKVFAFAREACRLRAEIATREFRRRYDIMLTCEKELTT